MVFFLFFLFRFVKVGAKMFILYETNHNNNDHIFFTQQKYQYNGVYHNMSAMRFLKWREI
jgi:hypothetical protein